jgi:hypothetical protein
LQPGAGPLWGSYLPDPAIRLLVSVNAVDSTLRFFRLYVKHKFLENLELGPPAFPVITKFFFSCYYISMRPAKLPYGTSNEKAQELKITDFGPPDEVMERAKPVRSARNRNEATTILKMIAEKGPLTSKSGLSARLTRKTIGKIVSSDALNKSLGVIANYQVAANLDRLFPAAIEPWQFELNPEKNNQGLKARRYLFAPMLYEENLVVVKFTVKEYLNPMNGNNLYSIEALDIILRTKNLDAWYD